MSLPGMIVSDTQLASLVIPLAPTAEADEAAPLNAFAQLLKLFSPPAPVADLSQSLAEGASANPELAVRSVPAVDSANLSDVQPSTSVGESIQRGELPVVSVHSPSFCATVDCESIARIPSAAKSPTSENALGSEPPHNDGNENAGAPADAEAMEIERRLRRQDPEPANNFVDNATLLVQSIPSIPPPMIAAPLAGSEVSDKNEIHAHAAPDALLMSHRLVEVWTPKSTNEFPKPSDDVKPDADITELADETPLDLPSEPVVALEMVPSRELPDPELTSFSQPSHVTPEPASANTVSARIEATTVAQSAVDPVSSAAVRETRFAVESQPVVRPDDVVAEAMSKQSTNFPVATKTSPINSANAHDRNAEPWQAEDHPSIAAIDAPQSHGTVANKHLDEPRRWTAAERPLTIEFESKSVTSGKATVAMAAADSEPSPGPVAALSRDDAANSGNEAFRRDARENHQPANPSVITGAVPTPSGEVHGNEVSESRWHPTVERLARDIVDHLRVGKQAAVLQLDPPDLGKVKIDLRIEDGQLHVRIHAEGHESQGLIENHLPELQQALRAGQIDIGELRVTQGDWNGSSALAQNFNQSPQGRQEAPRALAHSRLGDEVLTEPPAQFRQSTDGRVSMWA